LIVSENEKVYALVNTVGTTYLLRQNFVLCSTTKKTKMKTSIDNGIPPTATANSWRTDQGRKQQTKQSTSDTMSRRTTEDAKGGGDQSECLCLQKGYLDVRFMVGKPTSALATFNLARSLKSFIIPGRQLDANFCLLPLYGDVNPLSRPQDVRNSKDAITVYYWHRLAGNNVTGKMKIQSSGTIAQLKHATSTFKEYLLKDQMHINTGARGGSGTRLDTGFTSSILFPRQYA
jgi:hypothetical protein